MREPGAGADRTSEVLASLWSAAVCGVEGFPVRVETDLSNGLPSFSTVGLPEGAVREARERVISAVRNAGFSFPDRRVVVNLAPAERRKRGSHLDLAIALGVLTASGQIEPKAWAAQCCVLGELALDGSLRPVRGVLALALTARESGGGSVLVPRLNAEEAALTGMPVIAADSLAEAAQYFQDENAPILEQSEGVTFVRETTVSRREPDLADVAGQALARRALEISAAGGHNLLMIGPPGAGKSMLARRLPGILPPLERNEALEVTRIHSVAGVLASGEGVVRERPFRSPHATATTASMIGGGPACRPGEVVLAHRGVLFLDEFPEFRRSALEALRQPLEDRTVTVTRVRESIRFPADFALIAAMNPCPCGFRGSRGRECECSEPAVRRYAGRISGPMLDRLDLKVELAPLYFTEWMNAGAVCAEASAIVAKRVQVARSHAERRRPKTGAASNASLPAGGLKEICGLSLPDLKGMRRDAEKRGMSARSLDRSLRVARTIADLAGERKVGPEHLGEALLYRAAGPARA